MTDRFHMVESTVHDPVPEGWDTCWARALCGWVADAQSRVWTHDPGAVTCKTCRIVMAQQVQHALEQTIP